jgi:hypothetical protein
VWNITSTLTSPLLRYFVISGRASTQLISMYTNIITSSKGTESKITTSHAPKTKYPPRSHFAEPPSALHFPRDRPPKQPVPSHLIPSHPIPSHPIENQRTTNTIIHQHELSNTEEMKIRHWRRSSAGARFGHPLRTQAGKRQAGAHKRRRRGRGNLE